MSVSVRVESLTLSGLAASEAHGKRLDGTSQSRRIRDVEPLVFGGLDLRKLYDAHVDGCRMNAGLKKPVLHAIVQFPMDMQLDEQHELAMLRAAVKFINKTHGGHAVFAARLDRDEAGTHKVDVFYSPKYEKTTKAGVTTWISTSKHGKELCEKHREEIKRRHEDKFNTRPRDVGIAINSEFREFLKPYGFNIPPKVEKKSSVEDRLSPEEYKIRAENRKVREEAKRVWEENRKLRAALTYVAQVVKPASDLFPTKLVAFLSRFLPEEPQVEKPKLKPEPKPDPESPKPRGFGR